MENYSSIRKNDLLKQTTCMKLKGYMLSNNDSLKSLYSILIICIMS